MRQSRLSALFLTVMAVAAGSLAVASPASADPLGLVINYGNGLCIQPEGNARWGGAPIVQMPCDLSNPFQDWSAVCQDPGCGVFYVQNHGSGLCLNATRRASHAEITQWECNWISNVDWSIHNSPVPGTFVLESRISGSRGFCLNIPGGSGGPGQGLWLYECNDTRDFLWQAFRH
jgi:Ricin-type beta-trefoil lectin domain-like